MRNLVATTKQARAHSRRVYLTSTNVAISAGQGLCYDRVGTGTATVSDETRDKNVKVPDNTNNLAFAGVARYAYPAKAAGQWIEIFEPGSVCPVLVTGSVTIGVNSFVTCVAGGANAGLFSPNVGFFGRGTARVLQTVVGSVTALCELLDGPESGLVEIITPLNNAALQAMVGGVTYLNAAVLGTGNCISTLANGVLPGDRKGFVALGNQTTNKYLVTVTSGIKKDRASALASLAFAATNDQAFLTWQGNKWLDDWVSGAVEA